MDVRESKFIMDLCELFSKYEAEFIAEEDGSLVLDWLEDGRRYVTSKMTLNEEEEPTMHERHWYSCTVEEVVDGDNN